MLTKIRYGMIGGGKGGDIGAVHRFAARLDNQYELVCGAFSRNPQNAKTTGEELGLDPLRVYDSFETLCEQEALLPADKRVQVITIVTPNEFHFIISKTALEYGFDIICEKPLTFTAAEAEELAQLAAEKKALFCVNFTKAAYPMIKQMRAMVQSGKLGAIRKVIVDYRGSEFDTAHSATKQAQWRIDPSQAGPVGALGDIGSHAFHLSEYVMGARAIKVLASLDTLMPHRSLDDDDVVLLEYDNGAKGLMTVSQALTGERENLAVMVYGEKGAVKWYLPRPDELEIYWIDHPLQVLRLNIDQAHLDASVMNCGRTPGGVGEGHLGAIANYYHEFAKALMAKATGQPSQEVFDYPSINEGVRNMIFLEAALKSSTLGNVWVSF